MANSSNSDIIVIFYREMQGEEATEKRFKREQVTVERLAIAFKVYIAFLFKRILIKK